MAWDTSSAAYKAKRRRHYLKHRERYLAYYADYRAAYPGAHKRWRDANLEHVREYDRARRQHVSTQRQERGVTP